LQPEAPPRRRLPTLISGPLLQSPIVTIFTQSARVAQTTVATEGIHSIHARGIVVARIRGAIIDVVVTQRAVVSGSASTYILCIVVRVDTATGPILAPIVGARIRADRGKLRQRKREDRTK
jgi:hypothetical protein